MWFFTRKKRRVRKVFGFLCDPELALGVKLLAHQLEVPIYPLAEHLLQLGAGEVIREIEQPERKRKLQDHLLNGHLLVPALTGDEGKAGVYSRETNTKSV